MLEIVTYFTVKASGMKDWLDFSTYFVKYGGSPERNQKENFQIRNQDEKFYLS